MTGCGWTASAGCTATTPNASRRDGPPHPRPPAPGGVLMADIDTPVLIVGAGPAGLASSNLLSRHGVHHVLVEKHPGTA
ncbi:MAG TPA: FAD-dependent monooxygenase, partial [Pseudonocardia sp.]|nr:FAD-dependent monooxygenase [Pseudonocardia sp.]